MKTLYGVGAETFDEILNTNRAFEPLQESETSTDLNADDPEASVVKFVNQIIREAIIERATDIHVEPLENDLRIRYRIEDRKSTRLNSSHQIISYAVFCLKKKKKKK